MAMTTPRISARMPHRFNARPPVRIIATSETEHYGAAGNVHQSLAAFEVDHPADELTRRVTDDHRGDQGCDEPRSGEEDQREPQDNPEHTDYCGHNRRLGVVRRPHVEGRQRHRLRPHSRQRIPTGCTCTRHCVQIGRWHWLHDNPVDTVGCQ